MRILSLGDFSLTIYLFYYGVVHEWRHCLRGGQRSVTCHTIREKFLRKKSDVEGGGGRFLKKSIFTVTSFMDDPYYDPYYGHPTQVVSRLQFSFASWLGLFSVRKWEKRPKFKIPIILIRVWAACWTPLDKWCHFISMTKALLVWNDHFSGDIVCEQPQIVTHSDKAFIHT